jgi:hypothetical protein
VKLDQGILAAIIAGALVGWIGATGVKAQNVRLLDVFLVGPLAILATVADLPRSAKLALAFIGAATVTYNGRNWMLGRPLPTPT